MSREYERISNNPLAAVGETVIIMSVSPACLTTMRALLYRWAALGRPALLLPRQNQAARPYRVKDLGNWFRESLHPVESQWAPRQPWELSTLNEVLAGLEATT